MEKDTPILYKVWKEQSLRCMGRVKCFLCVLLLLHASLGYAQKKIWGTVKDTQGEVVASAVVFLEGTTCWATTLEDGSYELTLPDDGWFDLSVSHMNYHVWKKRVNLETWQDSLVDFVLKKKDNVLEEIVITESKVKIKDRYKKKFWRSFLGRDYDQKGLFRVLNEEVVRFDFDEKARMIIVTADERIEVENYFLGYKVTFNLAEFTHSFRTRRSHTVGNSYFSEMTPRNEKQRKQWAKNRLEAYRGSLIHFCRSLYQNTSEAEGFQIYRVFTDSVLIAKEKKSTIPTKQRAEEKLPGRLFYYNWTRPLLLSSLPMSADSLCMLSTNGRERRLKMSDDLFIMYAPSQEMFMKKYYEKGINSRQKNLWDKLTEETFKPKKQLYLIKNRDECVLFADGSVLPSNMWVVNNITFFGIQYMLPYDYRPE